MVPLRDPEQVNVYDLIAKDKPNLYGIHDVGTNRDTAAFTVNTIRSWWNTTHPGAKPRPITADG